MDPARQTGWRSGWVFSAIAALLLLAVTAAPAAASGQAVVDYYRENGVISSEFTVTDLQDSKQLFAAQYSPGELPAIFDQIDAKIASIFGQKPPAAPPTTDPPEIPPSGAPVWEALLAGAAGLLVLAGAGSGIYRRNRRRMRPG